MFETFFKKIGIKKLSFSKKKSNSFLGVDMGSSAIKVVQLKKEKGVAVLETYGEMALGPMAGVEIGQATNLSDKQISTALINLVNESKVNVDQCGVSIPVRSSLVFDMEVPKVIPEQLKKIIPIEARRYIPVPISEVVLDWRIIPKQEFSNNENDIKDTRPAAKSLNTKTKKPDSLDKLKIFVVAIHKNAMEKYQRIIKNAKLDLNFLEIEIFSTIRSVVNQNIGTVVILDIGSSVTKAYIVEYGVVKDSHVINKGSQDISLAISRAMGITIEEAEKKKREIGLNGDGDSIKVSDIVSANLKYIFIEVNKIMRNYQVKYNKNIGELIFTGGGAVIKGLPAFASSSLEINSKVADPFNKIKNPAFLDDVLKEIGPEFAVAVGLALRGLED
ncbi:MAG: pilus assembly protein PilM [Candidatus Pacebacteria bacterium]|nr:pilus assembly protein PilM [Candidatus Paceibacterota bacterium]